VATARTKLREVDAVLLGVGLVGSILGREMTKAGLKVVGLERGEPRFTVPDFQGPAMHDELRYSVRKALMCASRALGRQPTCPMRCSRAADWAGRTPR